MAPKPRKAIRNDRNVITLTAINAAPRPDRMTNSLITTQKLLGPTQRGPHDRLFWFFHSPLLKEGRRLECSSSPR